MYRAFVVKKRNGHFAGPEREYQKAEKRREISIVYTGNLNRFKSF